MDLDEASRVRRCVELGLTADALPDLKSSEFGLLGYDGREELLNDIAAYQELRAHAASESLEGLPALPPRFAHAVEPGDARDEPKS